MTAVEDFPRKLRRNLFKPEVLSVVLLFIVIAIFQVVTDGALLTSYNVGNVLNVLPEIGLVVTGVTVLMIAGEFDLSVGSVFALVPMITFSFAEMGYPIELTLIAGLLASLLVGFVNGYVMLKYSLPSFITTLGMMFIVRSLTVTVSGGFPPPFAADAPTWLFSGSIGGLSVPLLWFLCIIGLVVLGLHSTNYGTWLYATGGQQEVARSVGISTKRVKIGAFMFCSLLAGLAGLMQVFRLHSPLPSLGEGLELQAIAAAVIGGVALTGGSGSVVGAMFGVLLLRVIDNGLVIAGVDSNWFKFAVGTIIVGAVIVHSSLRKYSSVN